MNNVLPAVFFSAGIIAESLFLIRHNFSWKRFLIFVLVFGALIPYAYLESDSASLGEYVALYILAFTAVHYKQLLEGVNEGMLLVLTMVFAYTLFARFNLLQGGVHPVLAAISAIPIIGTLVVALSRRPTPRRLTFLLYLWFIILSIILLIMRFSAHGDGVVWQQVFAPEKTAPANLMANFLGGVAVCAIGVQIGFLWLLLPSKYSGFKDSRKRARLMIQRFDNTQLHPHHAMLIIFGFGILLGLNFWFRFIPDMIMTDFAVAGVALMRPKALPPKEDEDGV